MSIGTKHCCICAGVCYHIGPIQDCGKHDGVERARDRVAEIASLRSAPVVAGELTPCPTNHEFKSTERVLKWKSEDGSFGGGWRDVEDNFCRDCGKPRPL